MNVFVLEEAYCKRYDKCWVVTVLIKSVFKRYWSCSLVISMSPNLFCGMEQIPHKKNHTAQQYAELGYIRHITCIEYIISGLMR